MSCISVVIPARDAAATLPRALAALAGQGADEVVVVDAGSRDETAAVAARAGARVVALPPAGPAAARNAGAEAASGELLAFLDADCFACEGWLAAGRRALEVADLVVGAVAPDPTVPLGPLDRSLWVHADAPLFHSANLLVRREAHERIGGFRSWLGPRAGKELGEDVLYGWTARRLGLRTAFAADALVHHAVQPRGIGAFVAERWRLRFFPRLVAEVPELRSTLCFRRVFLTGRGAALHAALVGAACRRPALAAPYLALAASAARRHGLRRGAAEVAADVVGAAALATGSARSGSLLL